MDGVGCAPCGPMRPVTMVLSGLGALVAVLLIVVATSWVTAWRIGRQNEAEGPTIMPEEEVLDQPHAPPSGIIERIIYRDNPAVRVGTAPGGAKEEVEKFVEAAKDTTKPKRLVPVRVGYHDDRLRLTVGRSDGAFESAEFDCEDGCDAWTRDSLIESRVVRPGIRLWGDIGRKVVKCGVVGAAGYGVGWAVNKLSDEVNREDEPVAGSPDEDILNPWLPAGVGAGACILLEVTPG